MAVGNNADCHLFFCFLPYNNRLFFFKFRFDFFFIKRWRAPRYAVWGCEGSLARVPYMPARGLPSVVGGSVGRWSVGRWSVVGGR